MQLESYFEFTDKKDIRIKETRIGIDIVMNVLCIGDAPAPP